MGITQSGLAAVAAAPLSGPVADLVALRDEAVAAALRDVCVGERFRGALPRATAAGYTAADPVARSCFVSLYLNALAVLAPDGVRTDAGGYVVGLGRASAV
jgi:hypothetical protein